MTIVVAILFGPLAFGLGLTYAHFLDVVSIDMILSSLWGRQTTGVTVFGSFDFVRLSISNHELSVATFVIGVIIVICEKSS